MNVTVLGSYRPDQSDRLEGSREDFEAVCLAIGKKLAELGYRLIVPHPDKDYNAELHALHGFQEVALARHRYRVCPNQPGDLDLKGHFDAVEMSDAVICIGGLNGTYAAGLSALRRRKLILPIPAFGGSAKDLCTIPEIDNMLLDTIRNPQVGSQNWINDLVVSLEMSLRAFPRILIIHGRGDDGSELSKRICAASKDDNSRLSGISSPVIMNLSGMGAISVPAVFEMFASQVSATIAIVTADDIGGFARRGDGQEFRAIDLNLEARARENVWVEVGWFWGRLGRHRVFLWLKDNIKLPSDLAGVARKDANNIDGAWNSIENFLNQLRKPNEGMAG